MSTITSYAKAEFAWTFITYLHRLMMTPDKPFCIGALTRAPETVRLRLFQARKFLIDTESFYPFHQLAICTIIKRAGPTTISILSAKGFESAAEQSAVVKHPFIVLLRQLDSFIAGAEQATYLGNLNLDNDQVEAIRAYLKAFPVVRLVTVSPTSILLRK